MTTSDPTTSVSDMTMTTDSNGVTFRNDVTVELVKHAASDDSVLFAARVSTRGETHTEDLDPTEARNIGLIRYLMRDRHGSPFEHNSMTFYVEAPIFVFREFMRHRIASYNEESGRYTQLKPVFYIPADSRAIVQKGKPGHYTYVPGLHSQVLAVREGHMEVSRVAYSNYQYLLDLGVAREVARMSLPLNIFSSMYVTMNARALMNFLSLRTKREGSHFPSYPQREIEMVAEQMEEYFKKTMPITHAAFNASGRVAP